MTRRSKKRLSKKTPQQAAFYRSAVQSLSGYDNTREDEVFESLKGSNEGEYDLGLVRSPEKCVGVKRQKAKNFFKEHVFEIIITIFVTLICAAACWLASSVISLREDIAVFKYRIEVAETSLNSVSLENVTKEYLAKELEVLRLELDTATAKSISEIELQIKLIENQIEYIKENSNKTSNNE